MTTKLKEISKWLEVKGVKHKYKKKAEAIVFAIGDEEGTQLHFITKKKGSKVLQLHMQIIEEGKTSFKRKNFVNIKDNIHKDKILEYLLYLNYTYKIGSWEYDYNDGDVRFYAAFPLDDAKMSRKQFDRLFHAMTISGNEGAKAIAHITETGGFPEDRLDLSMLAELFEAFQEYQKTTDDVIDTDVVE